MRLSTGLHLLALSAFGLLLSGCITTGQHQTGRVLQPGQAEVVVSSQLYTADNTDADEDDVKVVGFLDPGVGLRVGLPLQFQPGLRVGTWGLQGDLRWELTPPAIEFVDLAVGYTLIKNYNLPVIHRYSLTLSHNAGWIEPYAYAAKYRGGTFDTDEDDLLGNIINSMIVSLVEDVTSYGAGAALRVSSSVRVYPELRCDVYPGPGSSEDLKVWYFGLGLGLGKY